MGLMQKLVMSDGGYPICMEFDRVIKNFMICSIYNRN